MPKKKTHFHYAKPSSSYVHPSLAPKGNAEDTTSPQKSSTSVNERIEHLRRVQGHDPVSTGSTGLGSSRHAPAPPNRRQVAGPPPPRSWMVSTDDVDLEGDNEAAQRPQPCLWRLPGAVPPRQGSLQDLCLRSMGRNLDWHLAFDHAYLSTLPVELKSQLLSYVAVHSGRGISKSGLDWLFLEPQDSGLEGSSGSYDVTRIDLTRSLGRSVQLSELDKVWTSRHELPMATTASGTVLDSWEDDLDMNSLSLTSVLRFPRLTHLSLAHPSLNISWQDLLAFSSHLGSLTHLCLDFWPRPALPEMQSGSMHDKSLFDDPVVRRKQSEEEEESAIILRLLSRNTPSLKWLSVAGCHSWFDALTPQADSDTWKSRGPREGQTWAFDTDHANDRRLPRGHRPVRLSENATSGHDVGRARGPDWNGCWRHVRHVNLSQDWIPHGLRSQDLVPLVIHRKARSANREALRAEPFRPTREPETYRLSSDDDAVQRQIHARLRRNRWLLMERMSIFLAASVDRKRLHGDLPAAECDFGWGRPQLLAAGYAEQMVFDAGL